MKKGFILIISVKVFLIATTLYLIRYKNVYTYTSIVNESEYMYKRLRAEKAIFDEVLFNLSLYDEDDFTYFYDEYFFDVTIKDNEVKIKVESEITYTINLTYDDDCVCFVKIAYK